MNYPVTKLLASIAALSAAAIAAPAQTLYAPGGTVGSITGSNVGIGTATPPAKFSVAPGNSAASSVVDKTIHHGVLVEPTSGRTGYAVLATNSWLDAASDNAAFGFYHPFDASNSSAAYKVFRITTGTESGETNNPASSLSDRFYVTKGGGAYFENSVGIGTTTPSHKLEVNGTIRTKEVIVESTGWPDYVFDEDYPLPSLSSVEQHIREHKHLPDVPSSAVVAENGVSIGEMQATLLRKIEELTLHAIRQESEIDALKARIVELEGR